MLGWNERIDEMAMASSVRWYGDVLRRDDDLVLRSALDFEVEGQRKKGKMNMRRKKQFEEKGMKICLIRGNALCQTM